MDWRDEGVLLSTRKHGESAAIIEVFTKDHGRHAGVVRGGAGRRMAPILQPGAQLSLEWRARLEDHLGAYQVDLIHARTAEAMASAEALLGLGAVTALLGFSLPEREAHLGLYTRSVALLDALGAEGWGFAYLRWELALLAELGFALDLGQCAVTGAREGLAYISPKTGAAVTAAGAGEWIDRLLPYPEALRPEATGASNAQLLQGFHVTGYFLTHHLAPALGNRPPPPARQRYVDWCARQS